MTADLPTAPAQLRALLVAERAAHAVTQGQRQAAELERDTARLLLQHTTLERDAAQAKLQALLKRYFPQRQSSLRTDDNCTSLFLTGDL
jgi:uncharacterized protein (DUF3084 family)